MEKELEETKLFKYSGWKATRWNDHGISVDFGDKNGRIGGFGMKKLITFVVILSMFLAACGDPLKKSGKVYECYGLLDRDTVKSEQVVYTVCKSNVIWSILFFETIFVPIWLLGFHLYCPVSVNQEASTK